MYFCINNGGWVHYDYKRHNQTTGIPVIGNILPLKKNNIIPIKINKKIEIVVVPNLGPELNSHQDNVGIILEEKKIQRILSKRYKHVLITEINSDQ